MLSTNPNGLSLDARASLQASQTEDGSWVAWIEVERQPITGQGGEVLTFQAPTRYQAQCQAYRWYYPHSPFSGTQSRRRRSASG